MVIHKQLDLLHLIVSDEFFMVVITESSFCDSLMNFLEGFSTDTIDDVFTTFLSPRFLSLLEINRVIMVYRVYKELNVHRSKRSKHKGDIKITNEAHFITLFKVYSKM